jgi:integrase
MNKTKEIIEIIAAANQRLKAANIGVQIESKNRLCLRATLPPKPESTKTKPYQQRIYLGIPANRSGVKRAEKEALKLGGLLACKEFAWSIYIHVEDSKLIPAGEWVARLENFYFQKRKRTPKSEYTWKCDYYNIFKRLDLTKPLTPQVILQCCTNAEPETKNRKRACMALNAIAKFADIEVNLKPYAGSYTAKSHTPRDLPDDSTIARTYYEIKNPAWQWVYGMIAAYGLRNHEVFRLDLRALKAGESIITVLANSKTGTRRVWAFFPEWFEEWELYNPKLPNVNVDSSNPVVGRAVTQYFRRYLPFRPYDLRHCWAIRTLEFGLDLTLAAQQMGHSVKMHTDLYHHWISERHHQRAYEILVNNPNRPTLPIVLGKSNGKILR